MAVRMSKPVPKRDGSLKCFSVQEGRMPFTYIALGWKKESMSALADWSLCHEGMPMPTRRQARQDGQDWCNE